MYENAAGKFEVYKRANFDKQTRKILYIGKATKGPFDEETAAADAFEGGTSAFWTFATAVSRLADPTGDGRANLAWSNIFKHGAMQGNPAGEMADQQKEEAITALINENQSLKPDLIVLVTADYYEEIPKAAFSVLDGESSGKDGKLRELKVPGQRYSVWSREAYGKYPPIVWMNHPQGKLDKYKQAVLREIELLTQWGIASGQAT